MKTRRIWLTGSLFLPQTVNVYFAARLRLYISCGFAIRFVLLIVFSMRDYHSDLTAFSWCAWRRHVAYAPCYNWSCCVFSIPSLAASPAYFSSFPSAGATVSSLVCHFSSRYKFSKCIVPSSPPHPYPACCLPSRSSPPSCLRCTICCSSLPSTSTLFSPFPSSADTTSPVRSMPTVRSPAAAASTACSSLPCRAPTVSDCPFIHVLPPIPSRPSLLNHVVFHVQLKSASNTTFPACRLRCCSSHTQVRISSQPLPVSSSSVSSALPRVVLSAAAATTVAVLGTAAASGAVTAVAAAAASAAAAAAAIPAVTTAGNAVANTTASAAATVAAGGGVLSLVSCFFNSRLHPIPKKALSPSSCSTNTFHRNTSVPDEILPSNRNLSPSSDTLGHSRFCGSSLRPIGSSILSASVNLSNNSSNRVLHTSACIPSSSTRRRYTIAACLQFTPLPSWLEDILVIFRPPSTAVATSYPPQVANTPVPVGQDGQAALPSPADDTVFTDFRGFARAAPRTVAPVTGASAAGNGAVIAAGRLLIPREVSNGSTKAEKASSVAQGLRELLEELTVQFWKGNRWKGPQKNKWKWYHRHGYWATRKKLIDFTKYRRYGYHERYGMGRPKMKFWEDPSRYKRLRQAVRFW